MLLNELETAAASDDDDDDDAAAVFCPLRWVYYVNIHGDMLFCIRDFLGNQDLIRQPAAVSFSTSASILHHLCSLSFSFSSSSPSPTTTHGCCSILSPSSSSSASLSSTCLWVLWWRTSTNAGSIRKWRRPGDGRRNVSGAWRKRGEVRSWEAGCEK